MFWSVLFPLRKLSGRLGERLGTESRLIPADAAEPSVSETKRACAKESLVGERARGRPDAWRWDIVAGCVIRVNIGALIIRTVFEGTLMLYYNDNKTPPQ